MFCPCCHLVHYQFSSSHEVADRAISVSPRLGVFVLGMRVKETAHQMHDSIIVHSKEVILVCSQVCSLHATTSCHSTSVHSVHCTLHTAVLYCSFLHC